MSSQQERVVNVIPFTRIKKEVIKDDEDMVSCRLCSKGFASEVALANHARMEHMDAFATGDSSVWMKVHEKPASSQTPKVKIQQTQDKSLFKIKKDQLLSKIQPSSLMALASNDVSYIIIKADEHQPKRRRIDRMVKKEEKMEKFTVKKDKELEPITGPFECLQPSTLVADGTCHQIFFSCCQYSTHFRDEHTRRRKGLRCQVCEKPLAGSGDDQAAYSCDACGIGFGTSKELSEHMAISHIKLKPFECNVCHKRFTQQGGVQQHMRMHTGDRPFPCTFCPKAFTQKSGLDQHLRIHTKVKPYRCVVCSKSFCQSVHLKQHMRTHTNVAPFQCGICEKRFKQSSHLNYHLKNHNPANLTEEQRAKYAELVGIMTGNYQMIDSNGTAHNVEVNEYGKVKDGEADEYDEGNDGEAGEYGEGNDGEADEYTEVNDAGEVCDTVINSEVATEWCVTMDNNEIVGI